MKVTLLDFERDKELEFQTIPEAQKYCESVGWGWDYLTRYVNDWSMKNDARYNEWLEVNCHNSFGFVVPTNALHSSKDLFDMIVYWHEQIAYGNYGQESVAFEFTTEKKQKEYGEFQTKKYLAEKVNVPDTDYSLHDYCNHLEELEEELKVDIDMDTITDEQQTMMDKIYDDCEEYQLDQTAYDQSGHFYGGVEIDKYEVKEYILERMYS